MITMREARTEEPADRRELFFHGLREDAVQFRHGDRLRQMDSETGGFASSDILRTIVTAQSNGANGTGGGELAKQIPAGSVRQGKVAQQNVEPELSGYFPRRFYVERHPDVMASVGEIHLQTIGSINMILYDQYS